MILQIFLLLMHCNNDVEGDENMDGVDDTE